MARKRHSDEDVLKLLRQIDVHSRVGSDAFFLVNGDCGGTLSMAPVGPFRMNRFRRLIGGTADMFERRATAEFDPQETLCPCATLLWQTRSKPNYHFFAAQNPSSTLPRKACVRFTSETCFVLFGA